MHDFPFINLTTSTHLLPLICLEMAPGIIYSTTTEADKLVVSWIFHLIMPEDEMTFAFLQASETSLSNHDHKFQLFCTIFFPIHFGNKFFHVLGKQTNHLMLQCRYEVIFYHLKFLFQIDYDY